VPRCRGRTLLHSQSGVPFGVGVGVGLLNKTWCFCVWCMLDDCRDVDGVGVARGCVCMCVCVCVCIMFVRGVSV
jgi:hypothetical protein